jgi:hypothetical protein
MGLYELFVLVHIAAAVGERFVRGGQWCQIGHDV